MNYLALFFLTLFSCRQAESIAPSKKLAFDLGDFGLQIQLTQSGAVVRKLLTVNLYYFEPDENAEDATADVAENFVDGDGDEAFTVSAEHYDIDGNFGVNIESASIAVFDVYSDGKRIAVFSITTTGQVHSVTKELSVKSGRLAVVNPTTGKYIFKVNENCFTDWANKIVYYHIGNSTDNNMPYTTAQLAVMKTKNGWRKFSIRGDKWIGFTKTLPTGTDLVVYTTQKIVGNSAYSAVFQKIAVLPANPTKDLKNYVEGGVITCSCGSN